MITESRAQKAVYPSYIGGALPSERRAMPMYVTYSDLFQIGIFIVSLIGLMYEIFKDKNKPPLLALVTADLIRG